MERGQGGDAPGEAAAFLPIGHLQRKALARFSLCLPGADTDASGGDAITKGFIREKKSVKVMGLLAGMRVPCFSLCCLQSPFTVILHFLHFPLCKGSCSLYKEKQSPGEDIYRFY